MTEPTPAANTSPKKDDGDYLGYGVYADTLWARVERALAKDQFGANELGDDPLVVGIFGEWGAGKSKLLKLVQNRADLSLAAQVKKYSGDGAIAGDSTVELTIPVYFQSWKYEHEEHLLIPMLLHIVAELEATLGKASSEGLKLNESFHKAGDAVVASMKSLVEGFGKLYKSVQTAHLVTEPATATALMALANFLPKFLGAKKTATSASQFSHKDDGRSYYDMHAILKQLTRPGGKAQFKNAQFKNEGTRANFVIFIDDLDRCLPENAVKTLELIKTIFNLESFAFVLALDEEVVERGIAHRYKDYGLADKKHDMPITGFEYLEKIVHLPFRLPALGQEDALKFIQEYEAQLLKLRANVLDKNDKPRQAWFLDQCYEGELADQQLAIVREALIQEKMNPSDRFELRGKLRNEDLLKTGTIKLNLAHLVLNAFVAYVPRAGLCHRRVATDDTDDAYQNAATD